MKKITKERVLEALKKQKDFISARELAKKLGAGRNWSMVELELYHLAEEGRAGKIDSWEFRAR